MKRKFIAKDGTEFILRAPKISDAKDLMKMINSVIREKKNGINADKPYTLKQEKAWLKGIISAVKSKQSVDLIIEVDGKVRGNCEVGRKAQKQSHRAIFGIVLAKEIRGKGIGKIMMNEVMNIAKKKMKGLEIFELEVYDYNKNAYALYKKLGFKRVATIPKSGKEGRKYAASYHMQLEIK